MSRVRGAPTDSDPVWYRDAIRYELHVRSFADSNADGIGDFRGLTEKLDYLQDLGVTAIWLLPFYPSPLKDDGYDIADYTSVHPSNFESREVRRHLPAVLNFWLGLGVDGMRLDAIPYLFERDGTNCENLPETHAFLKTLRRYVDERFSGRMLLGEANQWPEDAVAYFGDGDECHMAFHFPLMPRMSMSVRMENRFPIVDILDQTPSPPPTAQWALFLRNHDELTLEMVTDEERDYMYRVYAEDPQMRVNVGIRRRLAPLLGNDRRKIELLNGLLFSLPGTPVLYYGDEIGTGDNIYLGDRNGVWTPMQWSADRNAGFSRASSQRLSLPLVTEPGYHFESVNVEALQNNPSSLLWWMKRLIALRKQYRAFGRGTLEMLHPANRKVLAFLRCHGEETIFVAANLSRFAQVFDLDLSRFGSVPVELFGKSHFPPASGSYRLSLGPHGFLWLSLETPRAEDVSSVAARELPMLGSAEPESLWRGSARAGLEEAILRAFDVIDSASLDGAPTAQAKAVTLLEAAPLPYDSAQAWFLLLRADFSEGEPETRALPVAIAEGEHADLLRAGVAGGSPRAGAIRAEGRRWCDRRRRLRPRPAIRTPCASWSTGSPASLEERRRGARGRGTVTTRALLPSPSRCSHSGRSTSRCARSRDRRSRRLAPRSRSCPTPRGLRDNGCLRARTTSAAGSKASSRSVFRENACGCTATIGSRTRSIPERTS